MASIAQALAGTSDQRSLAAGPVALEGTPRRLDADVEGAVWFGGCAIQSRLPRRPNNHSRSHPKLLAGAAHLLIPWVVRVYQCEVESQADDLFQLKFPLRMEVKEDAARRVKEGAARRGSTSVRWHQINCQIDIAVWLRASLRAASE
jgi:hypothetical protein